MPALQSLISLAVLAIIAATSVLPNHPPADPLEPVVGWETRYVLVNGEDSRVVSRAEFDSYADSCSNGADARRARITPGYHVRVFACAL